MNKPVYRKYVVVDDGVEPYIIIARCTFHNELVGSNKCLGGGFWDWDREGHILKLSGTSDEFGVADFKQVEDIIANGHVYTSAYKHRKFPMHEMLEITWTWSVNPSVGQTKIDIPEADTYEE